MRAACRLALLVLVLAATACGGSGSARIEADSGQLYELVVRFEGKGANYFGTSHEWWSPRSDLLRVEHRTPRASFELVYDGSAITKRTGGKLFKAQGEEAMLDFSMQHLSIFEVPGVVALKQHLEGRASEGLKVTERDGGKAFDVKLDFGTDTGEIKLAYTIQVRDRMSERTARRRGLLRPLSGQVVGEFRQSPPGTPPHFGEPAYWFGPTLGEAKAATALEVSGGDPFRGEPGGGTKYTTMYRLPSSGISTAGTYPGLGQELSIDIRVECSRERVQFLAQQSRHGSNVTLANGERATVYLEPYTQGEREGVFADVVVGGTACFVRGLVSAGEFMRLLPTLQPL